MIQFFRNLDKSTHFVQVILCIFYVVILSSPALGGDFPLAKKNRSGKTLIFSSNKKNVASSTSMESATIQPPQTKVEIPNKTIPIDSFSKNIVETLPPKIQKNTEAKKSEPTDSSVTTTTTPNTATPTDVIRQVSLQTNTVEDSDNSLEQSENSDKEEKQKIPFSGWDEHHATLAIHQWLKQNPGFDDLADVEKEELTDHYLNIILSGEQNPSSIRQDIGKQHFKSQKSVLPGKIRQNLPSSRIFSYDLGNSGGEPEQYQIIVPAPVGPNNISFVSQDFPLWLENALRQKTAEKDKPMDWSIFPALINQYGRTISPRMYVMTVILIESRGIHRRKGKLYSAQGFHGFMQLGLTYKKYMVAEPQANLMHGVRHLYPCIYKTMVQDEKLRKNSTSIDRLIMASVCYNRGRYSRASKQTWQELINKTSATPFKKKKYFGLHDNRIAVKYGIQTKAYLGFPLSRQEKTWIREFTGITDADTWCLKRYSWMRNALLGRAKLSLKYGQ